MAGLVYATRCWFAVTTSPPVPGACNPAHLSTTSTYSAAPLDYDPGVPLGQCLTRYADEPGIIYTTDGTALTEHYYGNSTCEGDPHWTRVFPLNGNNATGCLTYGLIAPPNPDAHVWYTQWTYMVSLNRVDHATCDPCTNTANVAEWSGTGCVIASCTGGMVPIDGECRCDTPACFANLDTDSNSQIDADELSTVFKTAAVNMLSDADSVRMASAIIQPADSQGHTIPSGLSPFSWESGDPTYPTLQPESTTAMCRCSSVNLVPTIGLSMCTYSGCGNPYITCDKSYGCSQANAGCNPLNCTCVPDGVEGTDFDSDGAMTYRQCLYQCTRVGMVIPRNADDIAAVGGTGCGANARPVWVSAPWTDDGMLNVTEFEQRNLSSVVDPTHVQSFTYQDTSPRDGWLGSAELASWHGDQSAVTAITGDPMNVEGYLLVTAATKAAAFDAADTNDDGVVTAAELNAHYFCSQGVLNTEWAAAGTVCCGGSCGICGGNTPTTCDSRPGGYDNCCMTPIINSAKVCGNGTDVACNVPTPVDEWVEALAWPGSLATTTNGSSGITLQHYQTIVPEQDLVPLLIKFLQLDTSDDLYLSQDELATVLRVAAVGELNMADSETLAEALMRKLKNVHFSTPFPTSDRKISAAEFIAGNVVAFIEPTHVQAFVMQDTAPRNGFLDLYEFVQRHGDQSAVLQGGSTWDPMSIIGYLNVAPTYLMGEFDAADTSDDGVIEVDELLAYLQGKHASATSAHVDAFLNGAPPQPLSMSDSSSGLRLRQFESVIQFAVVDVGAPHAHNFVISRDELSTRLYEAAAGELTLAEAQTIGASIFAVVDTSPRDDEISISEWLAHQLVRVTDPTYVQAVAIQDSDPSDGGRLGFSELEAWHGWGGCYCEPTARRVY